MRMRRCIPCRLIGSALRLTPLVFAAYAPTQASAQTVADSTPVLTLSAALSEARQANAQLPVAEHQMQGALARADQARGELYPALSLDGDVHAGAPQKYASGDAFMRVLAQAPLYEGGQLRAARDRTAAEAQSYQAGYQVAVRDVDYAVRIAYAGLLRAQDGLAFRLTSIDRLNTYLLVVQGRQASGQGVGADLLRTQQRLASAEADVASLRRELDDATMALNDVLGRPPNAPLRVASLPDPSAPADTVGRPWEGVPDLAQSQSDIRAAQASVQETRAGRKLHLDVEADAGAQPVLNSTTALLNNGTGLGTEVTLSFSLPFWDKGVYRGRVAEAGAALGEAQQRDVVLQRAARLAWTQATVELGDLYNEYQARSRAVDAARDAYLQSESAYRGGQGTALDVLDAYDAWIQADQDRLDVRFSYRVSDAQLHRWGNS
jgi:outer membrane protein, adhesin transport system